MTDNPLSQYFRSPAIQIELPSKGNYYPEGSLVMPPNGEVPILPMTALDEINYKTPDSLFNGSAIVDVIKSCVPAIKDPWVMPITDLTPVLTAIRIASFGHQMEVETVCPACGEEADYSLDLRLVLESIKPADYSQSLAIGDLTLRFKPMTYKDLNENSMLQFEEEKMSRVIADTEMETEKQIELLTDAFKKISRLTVTTLCKNIKSITTPESTVSEVAHIQQFLEQCDGTLFKKIKKTVIEQKSKEVLEPLHIECDKCSHTYEQPFTLDMTSFFAQDS